MPHRPFRRWCSSGLLVFPVVLSAALVHAQAARVTGTIVVGATKITPRAVSAVGYSAPNGQLISVLISDKAADRKEFLERTKVGTGEPLVSGIFEGAWKGLHLEKALSGFVFTINSDRRILTNEFLVGAAAMMSFRRKAYLACPLAVPDAADTLPAASSAFT